jgi:hypothetical protein
MIYSRDMSLSSSGVWTDCLDGFLIPREIKALLMTSKVSRSVVNSARIQYGLIHMYHV